MKNWAENVLYGIVDAGYVATENFEKMVRELAAGGVSIIQFRAKNMPKEAVLKHCMALSPLCRELGVAFIVNDYPDIAAQCGAAGVHIGQDDGALAPVRALLGERAIIGRSTHSYEQAVAAQKEGADYIGFGPLFLTNTKPGRPAIGLEDITRVHAALPKNFPIFCIGGIQPDRLPTILSAGAKRVVIVSWLLTHENVSSAARFIIEQVKASSTRI